jgi:hypothetical protein
MSGIYDDSKTFVDMPMLDDPEVIMAAFYQLNDPTDKTELQGFLN